MRTVEEIQKEIDEVSAAIRGIIGGAQSYTIGSRSVTKANLSELRAWRTDLESELAELQGGGVRYAGCYGR